MILLDNLYLSIKAFNTTAMKRIGLFVFLLCTLSGLLVSSALKAQVVPTISSFSPTSGLIGTTVTITGTNFSTTLTNNIVYFGATRATVTAATANELTVLVPSGATYQLITVTINGLTAYSSKPFAVTFPSAGVFSTNSFIDKVDIPTGANPWSVAIADIDGDGKSDLIAPNVGSATISVFRNIGVSGSITSSSFADKVDFSIGQNSYNLAVGDLDGDGKLDLAVASSSGSVSILKNTSTPGTITSASFQAKVDFTTGNLSGASSVAIGDLDGDGKSDIAVANNISNTVSVFRNTSTTGVINATSFAAKVDFSTFSNTWGVSIGDLDGDGKPEIAVSSGSIISVFKNISTPGTINTSSFAAKVAFFAGSVGVYTIAIGDLDKDNKPDMAINTANTAISVFRNNSTPGSITSSSFEANVNFSVGLFPYSVAISDLNGDGKSDLAVTNGDGNTVSILKNTTTSFGINAGSFSHLGYLVTQTNPSYVAIGDLDGDGTPDLAVANYRSNSISIIKNNISAPTIASFSPTNGPVGVTVTITGTNFSTTPGNNAVSFNGTSATVIASTTTTITTTVPSGATSGTISVTVNGVTGTSLGSFIVTISQTITFTALADVVETVGTFPLAATASSGLPVSFSTTSNDKISITGSTVSIINPGSVIITAKQSGNIEYLEASPVSQTICILPKKPTITSSGLGTGNAILTSSASVGNQWYRNGNALPGAINGNYIIDGEGLYTVQVTIEGCASVISEQYAIIITDLENTQFHANLSLFPVPVGRELSIILSGVSNDEVSSVMIYDLTGMAISQESMIGSEGKIIVGHFASGNYLLRVSNKTFTRIVRFVKE